MDSTPGASPQPPRNSDRDFEEIRRGMTESANPAQDEADRRARVEYLRGLTGQSKPKRGKTILKILLVVLVVAGLAGGVFWYFTRAGEQNKAKREDTAQKQSNTPAETPVATKTKRYESSTMNLGFDYPENWKVTDEGSGKLLVTSPVGKIKTLSGSTDGQVVFMIQSKQASLPAFKGGPGTAVRTSEKIAYAKPTQNQRAQTYMTFVSYPGAATTGIDSIFVTGDLGYQKDQDVPEKDLIGGDPLVSIFFAKCAGGTCAVDPTTTRTSVADSSWSDNEPLAKAAKAVLLSLTIN